MNSRWPQRPSIDDAGGPVETSAPASPRTRATPDEITVYLWEVYQRRPIKKDRGGDFSWKDPAAAKRMGKTLQAYVIVGMDADFREPSITPARRWTPPASNGRS